MSGEDPFDIAGTFSERARARESLAKAIERGLVVSPVRSPRGLDAITDVLSGELTHTQIVGLVNIPHPGLDDLTPLQWLREDGPAAYVIATLATDGGLFTTFALVRQVVHLLGAKLVAYIASQRDTATVRRWVIGDEEPPAEVTERLAEAFHAAFELRGVLAADGIQVWMQGINPHTYDVAPARLLREGTPYAGLRVLVAARTYAARSMWARHLDE